MTGHLDFEALVAQYYAPLYQFAYSLTRSESDACDLTQETFYIWAEKGHQLKDFKKVKSWLFTTLHENFLESRRRHTRFPHHELELVATELPSVDVDLVSQLDSVRVVELLSRDRCSTPGTRIPLLPGRFALQGHFGGARYSIGHRQIANFKRDRSNANARFQGSASSRNARKGGPVTVQEAKMVLLLYRPHAVEPEDPDMNQALELVRQHPDLQAWFEASLRPPNDSSPEATPGSGSS